ncbi:RE1, partial [Symbiodinium necroappetens]
VTWAYNNRTLASSYAVWTVLSNEFFRSVQDLHQSLLAEFEQAMANATSTTTASSSTTTSAPEDAKEERHASSTMMLTGNNVKGDAGHAEVNSMLPRIFFGTSSGFGVFFIYNNHASEMRQLKVLTVEDVNIQARSLGVDPETGKTGLLDSGASHAYRAGTQEEIRAADRVRVQLANGDYVTLAQNKAGTLLATTSTTEDSAAPIVPLGSLVQDLNCELAWSKKRGLEITHPVHGTVRPRVIGKCPLIGETQALQLIKELEDKRVEDLQRTTAAMQRALWLWDQDADWSKHLHAFLKSGERAQQLKAIDAEDSPFTTLSSFTKGAMAEDLVLNNRAGWKCLQALPVSRRRRKLLMASEWVVNLFAGPSDGTVEMKVLEDGCVLVEVDILRSRAFDLRRPMGAYRAIMWAAATGRVKGVMASPPMRSEDDEGLVGKAMWCSLVAKAARGYYEESPAFVMFEGARFVSYMSNKERYPQPTGLQQAWRLFVETMCLEEQYGTVVTNLDYDQGEMTTSSSSGRWTEEFKNSTTHAVTKWMWNPETRQRAKWMAKMDAGSFLSSLSNKELEQWRVHVKNNHLPYNRRCRTCVESSGTGRRHMKIKAPSAYCMSMDICGPFRVKGKDPDHADYRFALVVAYVIPRLYQRSAEFPGEGDAHGSVVTDHTVQIEGGGFVPEVAEDDGVGLGPLQGWVEGDLLDPGAEEPVREDRSLPAGMTNEEFQQVFNEVEGIEGYQVMYAAHPLRSRTTRDVLAAVQDVYLRFRAQGFPINRVHADRARELRSDPLRRWLMDRGTYVTYTEGQSPQANGRAEAAVKYAKTQTKRLLKTGNFAPRLWPMAMRYAMWAQSQKQVYPHKALIPFGTRVHVKKKVYGVGGKFDLQSKWGQGFYMGPSADVNDGSVVMMDKGTFITTCHMRPGLVDADKEVELEDYHAIVPLPHKRLRRKSTLNPADYEGLELQPLRQEPEEAEEADLYDPNHPAEEFARAVLFEDVILRDYVETLANLLPSGGAKPKRFGEQHKDELVWSSGAYVFSGIVGVAGSTSLFPRTTKVFCEYLRTQCPEARFNSIAVFKNIQAKRHKDAHNVGRNVAVPLSDFKGTDIIVSRGGERVVLKVSDGPQFFDPHEEHETTPCSEGTSWVLVGYSIRDSEKLKDDDVKYLESLGFTWEPHRAREQLDASAVNPRLAGLRKAEVKDKSSSSNDLETMDVAKSDLDLVIQDLEERAVRLRELLEEEEIMAEQATRLGQGVREELADTRDYVCKYLDDVHRQLMQFQRLREGVFLRSARQVAEEDSAIDYEKLLEELEGDLDIVHTVPLDQVKTVLQRWEKAIEKEVGALFSSGTLTKISYDEAKALEKRGDLRIIPSKCVFTLKPPNAKGEKCRRKCRLVICGNYITKEGAEDQASLYAAGTSTDALRLALAVASSRLWLAAIADITSAFLLAEWPPGMPKYAIMQPRVIRDSGDYGSELWLVQRPLYGLRESPVIWSEFRNMKLKQLQIMHQGRRLRLFQAVSESELWFLRDELTNELYGLLVVYVDDLMYLAEKTVIEEFHKAIRALWPTSALEWIDDTKAVRYLGVEIKQDPSSRAFSISQQAYIAELLRAHNMQNAAHTQLPMPREWLENLELGKDDEPSFTEADLRQGQRVVGEALWLATKTRPDILYTVNAMASHVARRPLQIARIGERLLAYLAGTADMALVLRPPGAEERSTMTCFTDASFAPFGSRSYGATVVLYGQAAVAWKAGKQSFVTMSTMEAELYAAAQGYVLLESVASILKVRASYIREAVEAGRLTVKHTPGDDQLADLATKLVTKDRLWKLLDLWGFVGGKLARTVDAIKMKMMLFVMMIVSMVRPSAGASTEQKEAIQVSGMDELLIVTGLVCVSAIVFWEVLKMVIK